MTGQIERVVVMLDAASENRSAIDIAVRLAVRTRTPLHGLFVEDQDLLRLAGLPFARQVTIGGGAEPLTHETAALQSGGGGADAAGAGRCGKPASDRMHLRNRPGHERDCGGRRFPTRPGRCRRVNPAGCRALPGGASLAAIGQGRARAVPARAHGWTAPGSMACCCETAIPPRRGCSRPRLRSRLRGAAFHGPLVRRRGGTGRGRQWISERAGTTGPGPG